jgi:hypothetical protein
MSAYDWIIKRPSRRGRPYREVRSDPCPRCGYDPVTGRKKCPACMASLGGTDAA